MKAVNAYFLGVLSGVILLAIIVLLVAPGIFIPKPPEVRIEKDTFLIEKSYTAEDIAKRWESTPRNSVTTMIVIGENYMYNREEKLYVTTSLTRMKLNYEVHIGYEYISLPMALKEIYVDSNSLFIRIPDIPPDIIVTASRPAKTGPWVVWSMPKFLPTVNFYRSWVDAERVLTNAIHSKLIDNPESSFRHSHRQSFTNLIQVMYPEFDDIKVEFYSIEQDPEIPKRNYTYSPDGKQVGTYDPVIVNPPEEFFH